MNKPSKDDVDELHTNFKLRSDEKLALVSPTGDFIDIVDTQELLPNQSLDVVMVSGSIFQSRLQEWRIHPMNPTTIIYE